MPRLGDLDLDRHLRDPAIKANFVTPMFDLIAPRYDDFTRLFSFGMDRGWKRELLSVALAVWRAKIDDSRSTSDSAFDAVDLACGTGDIAFALAAESRASVVGIDASQAMIARAQTSLTAAGSQAGPGALRFVVGDLGATGLPDQSADIVTASYAYRNGPPLQQALAESARILRPGGVLAVLDFYKPANIVWRSLFVNYLRLAGNAVGWWWHREPVAYGYIAKSIETFVSAADFTQALHANRFGVVDVRRKLGGGVAIHIAVRTAERVT